MARRVTDSTVHVLFTHGISGPLTQQHELDTRTVAHCSNGRKSKGRSPYTVRHSKARCRRRIRAARPSSPSAGCRAHASIAQEYRVPQPSLSSAFSLNVARDRGRAPDSVRHCLSHCNVSFGGGGADGCDSGWGSMWQERVGAPEFGGTKSGRRVRTGARQAPPERAHAAAPPAHAAPDVSQVPPLWIKGGTPRVDERGRLVASEVVESAVAPPPHSSPSFVGTSLSGSDAADSTMELSAGSCDERKSDGYAPLVAAAGESSAGGEQMTKCDAEEDEPEADDDENWSPRRSF
jgi:hypothetical protein